ncbi:MAG: DUF1351 domain-containing protein [Lentilactobacillus buchneri]|jgi:hypothetical protein|nr:DUF1351 domain-containing protein [Lentilactobacillus buchneri]MCI1950704.1 DUF1351 domain-containing protein [Lentilactobacillus buchneri]MCI2018219.1 DUF1351 domain-containing protein [Lentilactobacillus buchneri]MCI2027830.1 DUF1351 domain-containing protein [Lentilactobacillus buchneri]
MASDLKLPDYTIDYRPTVISINNFDQLKTAVEAYAAKYQNLAVSTSTEKEAKASRAELRKLKAALDDKRKEIKKKYAEPYEAFANQIKDLESTLDASINPIDVGLKELEEHQRQTRLEHVTALIAEMAPNYHVESNEVEIDPTWLNKSTSKKKVTEGIADVMGYIKKKHDDLETGINAITKYAQAYNIDPAGWIDQLKQGQDVNYLIQAIDNQVKRNQDAQQRAEAQAATEKANQVQKGNQTIDKTTGEVVSHSVVLKITTTIPEMNLLKAYMDNKGIQYERVGG